MTWQLFFWYFLKIFWKKNEWIEKFGYLESFPEQPQEHNRSVEAAGSGQIRRWCTVLSRRPPPANERRPATRENPSPPRPPRGRGDRAAYHPHQINRIYKNAERHSSGWMGAVDVAVLFVLFWGG